MVVVVSVLIGHLSLSEAFLCEKKPIKVESMYHEYHEYHSI